MNEDEKLAQQIRNTLEREPIDDDTRAALHAARVEALDDTRPAARRRWAPAAAFAGLLLALAVVVLVREDAGEDPLLQLSGDELAVIASEDELELLEEFEFYVWFDEESAPELESGA